MSVNQNKNATVPFVLAILFSALATTAVVFYIIFYVTSLQGIQINASGNGDLGSGLQAAFGFLFSVICGVANLFLFPFSFGFSKMAQKRNVGKFRITSTILLYLNLFYLFATVISFIILYIMIN